MAIVGILSKLNSPTPEEVAEQEAQRADHLPAKLWELDIDPDSI